jgi:hypothetical protein
MDFKEASNAHRDWKIKLRTFVNGAGQPLDEATVRRDDACALGKWLHALPAEKTKEPLVADLIAAHTRFHQCAGEVVATANRGQREEALKMIDAGTPFADASFKVIGLIGRVAER